MNNLKLFYKKAENITLVATDFDGTLTDGSLYLSETGEITKRVSFKDLMGISRLKKQGFIIAIISGDISPIIDTYASKLKIEDVFQGIKRKKDCIITLKEKYQIESENICYIGDDINDIPALECVGLPIIVNNANYKLKRLDNVFISEASGGNGAIREVADLLVPENIPPWPEQ